MMNVAEVIAAGFDEVKDYIDRGFQTMLDRLAAVEARKAEKGEAGKDGIGLVSALIDRDGALVLTMADGRTVSLGRVNGQDGAPGKDGLGFDDLEMTHDGERGFAVAFVRGDIRKEFSFTVPAMIYRGIYREGSYTRGDVVTWGGSAWHCNEDTADKPGDGSKAWQLAVKEGRKGKDGVAGSAGAVGKEGRPGRDGRSWQ